MPELSVIVPTYNERDNVGPLVAALTNALTGISFELVFVDDDSPDGTSHEVRRIAQADPRVRIIQRIGRRGLSSAAIEGMMASSAPYTAVMDGDLQHDEKVLPLMLEKLKREKLDIVVGSRHFVGGSMGDFGERRVRLSEAGRKLSRLATGIEVTDPMSGFFVASRSFVDEVVRLLSGRGFKILLDLLASLSRAVRIGEVGYSFRARAHGASKLDVLVGLEYLGLLADKVAGDWIPVDFLLFAIVGTFGLLLHLAAVYALWELGHLSFREAQAITGAAVIALNFVLNNLVTFRRSRLRGTRFWSGLALFYIACGAGLWCNWQVAELLKVKGLEWYIASAGGAVTSSIWNYWMSSVFVWKINRRRHVRQTVAL